MNEVVQYFSSQGLPAIPVMIGYMLVISLIILGFASLYAGITSVVERKIAGRIQSRIGPNYIALKGFLQFLADGLKNLQKEDIIPDQADKPLFRIAPYIVFTGFQSQITPYLKLFDIFVMSSKEEGLGTSVLDAMSVSLPVVGTHAGGIPEMIDPNRGGLLVEACNPGAMKDAMLAMMKDSNLRKSFGSYNRKKVFDFSYEATADHTINIYKELLVE